MNDKQNNHLDMFRAVTKLADGNATIVNTLPAFKTRITALKSKITAIETTSGQQAQSITGVAKDKKALRQTLCEMTLSVISPVKAYAADTNNQTLEKKMDLSLSDLLKINDDEIAQVAKELYKLVEPLVVNLGDYGITSAVMTAWNGAITNYSSVSADPRLAIAKKSVLTKNLTQLFKEANKVCKKTLDPLAIKFKAGNPDFYNQYKAAREIIDLGSTTTLLKGAVTDKISDTAIEGAKVSLDGQAFSDTSDADGKYSINKITPGTYDIKVTKSGYKDGGETGVTFKAGKTVKRTFKLEKA